MLVVLGLVALAFLMWAVGYRGVSSAGGQKASALNFYGGDHITGIRYEPKGRPWQPPQNPPLLPNGRTRDYATIMYPESSSFLIESRPKPEGSWILAHPHHTSIYKRPSDFVDRLTLNKFLNYSLFVDKDLTLDRARTINTLGENTWELGKAFYPQGLGFSGKTIAYEWMQFRVTPLD